MGLKKAFKKVTKSVGQVAKVAATPFTVATASAANAVGLRGVANRIIDKTAPVKSANAKRSWMQAARVGGYTLDAAALAFVAPAAVHGLGAAKTGLAGLGKSTLFSKGLSFAKNSNLLSFLKKGGGGDGSASPDMTDLGNLDLPSDFFGSDILQRFRGAGQDGIDSNVPMGGSGADRVEIRTEPAQEPTIIQTGDAGGSNTTLIIALAAAGIGAMLLMKRR